LLCYRCGSFTPDDSRKCSVCGQPIASRRRQSRNLSGSTGTGQQRTIPPFAPDEILAGRYRIAEPAGPGTTGWVLRARDEEVDVDVAVKVLAQNLLQAEDERGNFLKTVKQARKVHHPNVVRIYDEGRGERHLYYTMPYLEGLSLRKIIDLRLERKQVFNFGEALPLFGQLALAIDSLDKFGAHGAIRPNNVVVLPDVLKLTGLPHYRGLPRKPFVALQQKASCLEYLAPEARREDGGGTVDRRSDVYSMAVIFAEMITGEVYGRNAEQWQDAEADLSPKMVSVLHRAFSDTRKSRYESATELFESLAAVGAEDGSVAVAMPVSVPVAMPDEPTDADGSVTDLPTVDLSGKRKALQRQDELDKELADLDKEIDLSREPQRPPPAPEVARAQAMRRIERRGAPPKRSPWVLMVATVIVLAGLGVSAAIYYQQRGRTTGLADLEPVADPAIAPRDVRVTPSGKATKSKPPRDKKRPDRRRKEPRRRDAALDRAKAAAEPTKPPPPPPPTPEPVSARVPVSPVAPPPPPPPPETPRPKPEPIEVAAASEPAPAAADAGRSRCPPGMVSVDGGTVEIGSRGSDPMRGFGELNAHRRKLDGFCMDVYEFPNQRGKVPTVNVSWTRAKRACERVSKRLCTEAEWERGCKGPKNARFPYGSKFDAAYCNVSEGAGVNRKPGPAGVFPRCRSGYGVVDMAGNVAEWTASGWGRGVPDKVVKGGGADQGAYMSRCAARANETASGRAGNIGFRCCAGSKR